MLKASWVVACDFLGGSCFLVFFSFVIVFDFLSILFGEMFSFFSNVIMSELLSSL